MPSLPVPRRLRRAGLVAAAAVATRPASAFAVPARAAANVTNITVQKQCVLDTSDHLEIAADPIALADMLNALDPVPSL